MTRNPRHAAQAATILELTAAYESARDLARRDPTPEHRDAAMAAWAALDAASPRRSVAAYTSRAGKRQHAEMRQMNHGRRGHA